MIKEIKSALISVFYKDGLELLARQLAENNVTIFSTGGTQQFLEQLGISCVPIEEITSFPPILGGRVKTLHPLIFGGILGKRSDEQHRNEMQQHHISEIDLVVVDLYPFEETVRNTTDESQIIEKIDIGGPSMIRAAAKNFIDVAVIAAKDQYSMVTSWLRNQNGTTLKQRRQLAAQAFTIVKNYDIAISDYFDGKSETVLRYGENPHQKAYFKGNLQNSFTQLNGKELSYNNLVDVDAAIQLMHDVSNLQSIEAVFAIVKHTNVCGIAARNQLLQAWKDSFAGDPESAFGGILISNTKIDLVTAEQINNIFFEVLIAPDFEENALNLLRTKKNRILLNWKVNFKRSTSTASRTILNGLLVQDSDDANYSDWQEVGGINTSKEQATDLIFANLVCKHLKSNAIALIKGMQLIGKGCGQTSRIDALRQAIEKAKQFSFSLQGAVLASDAFFPFDDCVKIAHTEGIAAFIQPGGSIRDADSISYCKANGLPMVITNTRHFRH